MIIRIRKHHLSYFRRKAARSNNEVFAMLLGRRISPSLIEVDFFKYPKLERSTPSEVWADMYSFGLIEEDAKDDGLHIVADIHSHVNYPPVLSPCDYSDLKGSKCTLSGVVSVIGGRTWVNFWERDKSLPVSIVYY